MIISPRTLKALTEAMEAHARWCHSGNAQPQTKGVMARLMETRGHFSLATGRRHGPINSLEERVESAMMKLAIQDLASADVVRLEYGAGWMNVLKRRQLVPHRFCYVESTQATRAAVLGVSERTYRNRLRVGQAFILEAITA